MTHREKQNPYLGFAIYEKKNRHGNIHRRIVETVCFDPDNARGFYKTFEKAREALQRMETANE